MVNYLSKVPGDSRVSMLNMMVLILVTLVVVETATTPHVTPCMITACYCTARTCIYTCTALVVTYKC